MNTLAEFAPVFLRSKQFDVLYHERFLDAELACIDVTALMFIKMEPANNKIFHKFTATYGIIWQVFFTIS